MRFLSVPLLLFGSCGPFTMATPSPQVPQQQRQLTPASIFGVSKRLPTLMSIRGGEVMEPESLDEVESILTKAGSEQKLVVIDFTASW